MRKSWLLMVVVLMLLPILQAQAYSPVPEAAPGSRSTAFSIDGMPTNQIIIKYKASANLSGSNAPASTDRMSRLSAAAGVQLTYVREMSGGAHVLRLPRRLPLSEVRLLADKLKGLDDVEYAEPDYILQHTLAPNDPRYNEQWHYFDTWGINAPAAWDITTGSSSVVVAVIDTGITHHTEFNGRTAPGYDFVSDPIVANDGNGRDSDPSDPGDWVSLQDQIAHPDYFATCVVSDSSWHGTHTAGTIGAASNNGVGVAGINWVSKILPVRVLGKCGGFTSDIVDGMRWAAGLAVSGVPANTNPAKVLSISLGGEGACQSAEQSAINDITAAGATVVVAAGNSNADASGFSLANCNGVVAVAATDRNGNKAYYSNYGSVVDISAPGGDKRVNLSNGVLSTLNTGTQGPVADTYDFYQGTSMATPHVAGVASLVLSLSPTLTPAQVQQILQSTARAFPGGSTCNTSICGSGIVDAGAAVGAMPRITSLSPVSATAGSGAFALTVNGANFVSGSKVNWNGSQRSTTFVNSNQLQAAITAADVSTSGTFSITVTGNYPSLGGSITTLAQPFTVALSGPDVSISKGVSNNRPQPGDHITFTLSIANTGTTVATGVVVTDIVPSQVLSPTFASTLSVTPQGVTPYVWHVGTMEVGQSGVITIYGQVDPGLASPFSFVNTASILALQDVIPGNNTSSVLIGSSQIYLPFVTNNWPPIPSTPTLSAINYSGGNSYAVSWSSANLADTYTLQEGTDSGFSSPTTAYGPGTALSWQATNKAAGTYYYRVKASNSYGDSAWSNVQSVTVQASSSSIANGDFESGSTGWTEYSTHGYELILNSGFPGSVSPHSGSWAVWLGGVLDEVSYIQQQVTVPSTSPYLAYWHWIASQDTCGNDKGGVVINGTWVDVYSLCATANTGGWVKHVVNLSAYAGQSVSLQIRSETNGSSNSNLFVDDVSFQSSPTSAQDTPVILDSRDAMPKPSQGMQQRR